MRTELQSAGCLCPKHARAIGRIAELEEEVVRLKARVSHLESRLKVEVRDAREMPFGENTPPSKVNFRKDSDEAARLRQGGARPGHEGHGRRRVPAEDADERQYCLAYILRKFLQLLRKEPDNPERKAFVPLMAGQLGAAMALRSRGLPPEAFAREAEAVRSKIAELAGRSARDPELQNAQNIFREHPDRVCHWARGPDIPAENNRAERGVRGLVIARKTSFGGQSEEALRVREVNQSVMETLALRCGDPAAKLSQALDVYARTGRKADVRDFLFPRRQAGRLDGAERQAKR